MTLQNYGTARVPGSLGGSHNAGQSTLRGGGVRLPGPLGIGPSVLVMDSSVVKIAPKTLEMPPPKPTARTKRVHVVTWKLGADSAETTDVTQGDLANCPVASILAAMANTPDGRQRISAKVKQVDGNVITDLSAVIKDLDNEPEWVVDRPKDGKLASKRYFTVDLPGITQEVSDVFYTDSPDRDWDLIYIGQQAGIHKDKGMRAVLWPAVVEKAYAVQLKSYEKLDALNDPVIAWKALIGPAPKLVLLKDLRDADITQAVRAADKVPTIATTRDDTHDATDDTSVFNVSGGLLVGWHGYTVTGMVGNQIGLYDPHGKSLKVSMAQFKKFFTTVVYGGFPSR